MAMRITIMKSIVGPGCGWASEDLGGVSQIDAAGFEDGRALGRIAGDPHRHGCTPNNDRASNISGGYALQPREAIKSGLVSTTVEKRPQPIERAAVRLMVGAPGPRLKRTRPMPPLHLNDEEMTVLLTLGRADRATLAAAISAGGRG